MARRTWGNIILHWLPFGLLLVAFGIGLYIEGENRQRDNRERAERVQSDQRLQDVTIRSDCERQQEIIEAVEQVIQTAISDQPPIAVPADADPALRRLLEGINASRTPEATAARRGELLALLPPVDDCEVGSTGG